MDSIKKFLEQRIGDLQKQNEQIKSIEDSIRDEYKDNMTKCELEFEVSNKKLQDLKYLIEKTITGEVDDYLSKTVPMNDKFIIVLGDIMSGGSIFFPEEHPIPEIFLIESLDQFKSETGLPDDVSTATFTWIKENVTVVGDRAKWRLYGRVKGYKGDETNFKVNNDYQPEIKDYVYTNPYDDVDWDEYVNTEPDRSDIDWPDHKSTMASAYTYLDVTLVFDKNHE